HNGESRKMAAKEGLVDAHVLERDDLLLALNLQHPVDQQKRISVRENGLDLIDVQRAGPRAALCCFSRTRICGAFVHSLKRAFFRSFSEARIIEDLPPG